MSEQSTRRNTRSALHCHVPCLARVELLLVAEPRDVLEVRIEHGRVCLDDSEDQQRHKVVGARPRLSRVSQHVKNTFTRLDLDNNKKKEKYRNNLAVRDCEWVQVSWSGWGKREQLTRSHAVHRPLARTTRSSLSCGARCESIIMRLSRAASNALWTSGFSGSKLALRCSGSIQRSRRIFS